MLESEKKPGKWQHGVVLALAGACVILAIFGAGFFVGHSSARGQVAPLGQRSIFPGGHGAVGRITQIEGSAITLQTRGGATQVIMTDSQTRVERGLPRSTKLTLLDLRVGDQVIVVGVPSPQRQIKARLIRVLNPPALTPTPTGL